MSVQMKPRFLRKERSQMWVNFTVMTGLQKPVAEINPASWVTWLQSMNYGRLVRPKFKKLHRFVC
jgi:hypothetical protein